MKRPPYDQIKGPNAKHYHDHFQSRYGYLPNFNHHWNEGLKLIREANREPTFNRMEKFFKVMSEKVYPELVGNRPLHYDAPLYVFTISGSKEIIQKEISGIGRIKIIIPWLGAVIERANFESLTVRIGKKRFDVKPYK